MNSKDTKLSSEELRKDVLVQLDKVDADLDQMELRLTPGQFIDDVIYYPRGGNPSATFDLLKENPVGATFLSLGTLLLMEDEDHQTYESVARAQLSSAMVTGKSKLHDVMEHGRENVREMKARGQESLKSVKGSMEKVKGKFHRTKDEFQGELSQTESLNEITFDGYSNDYSAEEDTSRKQAIEDAKSAFTEVASEKTQQMKSKVKELREKLPEASEVKERVGTVLSGARERLGDRTRQGITALKGMEPMTCIGIGAGLGVLTGMALPVSDRESELVGSTLESSVTSFTEELQSALNESAGILKDLVISDLKSFNVDLLRK